MRGVRGEPGQQAVGGVQFGGVGGRVDDGDDGVEARARAGDVVGVAARRGPSAGSSWAGKTSRRADRVAGVVDGEHGRAGGGGVPHLGVRPSCCSSASASRSGAYISSSKPRTRTRGGRAAVCPSVAAGSPAPVRARPTGGHGGQRGLQPCAVRGGEAVPSAVRATPAGQPSSHARRPVHAAAVAPRRRARASCPPSLPPRRPGAWPLLQHAVAAADTVPAASATRSTRAPISRGELLQPPPRPPPSACRPAPRPRTARADSARAGRDGVEHRVAGGELVVDQDQRPVPAQQFRVLGQQQVGGGVASGTPRSRPPAPRPRPGGGWSADRGRGPCRRRREWPSPVAVSA